MVSKISPAPGMTVTELMAALQKLPPNREVMIMDRAGGGGYPRVLAEVDEREVEQSDALESPELAARYGDTITVLCFAR